jgi:pimeloyl-ACP methyl ester carboxylesterase
VAGVFLLASPWVKLAGESVLHTERTFFGTYGCRTMAGPPRWLAHGTTLHGKQSLDDAHRHDPLTYYHRTGPFGRLMDAVPRLREPGQMAAIGLGVGTLAAYAQPGQQWTFFEIDPAIERIARDDRYFTFLDDCGDQCRVVSATPAVARGAAGRAYQLIALDAFSSDAIPMHLLTHEAMQVYLSHLAPHGVLAVHVSNRHLRLNGVVGQLAAANGLVALERKDRQTPTNWPHDKSASHWLMVARTREDLGTLPRDPAWECRRSRPGRRSGPTTSPTFSTSSPSASTDPPSGSARRLASSSRVCSARWAIEPGDFAGSPVPPPQSSWADERVGLVVRAAGRGRGPTSFPAPGAARRGGDAPTPCPVHWRRLAGGAVRAARLRPNALSFSVVREALARRMRVCSYDRAGAGWSDPAGDTLSVGTLADDALRVLDSVAPDARAVVVASSVGGLTAELLARRHPERVAGMVFLDAGTSDTLREAEREVAWTQLRAACVALPMAARVGLIRLADPFGFEPSKSETRARSAAVTYRPGPWETLCAMVRGYAQTREAFAHAPPSAAIFPWWR